MPGRALEQAGDRALHEAHALLNRMRTARVHDEEVARARAWHADALVKIVRSNVRAAGMRDGMQQRRAGFELSGLRRAARADSRAAAGAGGS